MAGGGGAAGVLRRARGLVAPSAAESRRKAAVAADAVARVEGEAAGRPEITGVELGGSYAKGTWLPGAADVDVFVRFDPSVPEARFREASEEVGFAAMAGLRPYARYADHPFVEASSRGTRINVVPCYDVPAGRWKSAADRSPFHTRLMRERLTAPLRRDARLLKLLLSRAGLYGAEIARRGMSGYAAETMVLYHGGVLGAARAMAGARRGQVFGRASREFGTLVAIADPVDPGRNLAAAVSPGNLARIALLCRSLLERPSDSLFRRRRPRRAAAALSSCVLVRFAHGPGSADALWGQLGRAAAAAAGRLGEAGFAVARSGAVAGYGGRRACLYFMLESPRIAPMRVREGPPFFSAGDAERFLSKNAAAAAAVWAGDDGRLRVLERRPERDAARLLERLFGPGLESSGVPRGLWEGVRAGVRVGPAARAGARLGEALSRELGADAAVFRPGRPPGRLARRRGPGVPLPRPAAGQVAGRGACAPRRRRRRVRGARAAGRRQRPRQGPRGRGGAGQARWGGARAQGAPQGRGEARHGGRGRRPAGRQRGRRRAAAGRAQPELPADGAGAGGASRPLGGPGLRGRAARRAALRARGLLQARRRRAGPRAAEQDIRARHNGAGGRAGRLRQVEREAQAGQRDVGGAGALRGAARAAVGAGQGGRHSRAPGVQAGAGQGEL